METMLQGPVIIVNLEILTSRSSLVEESIFGQIVRVAFKRETQLQLVQTAQIMRKN